jgi:heat shock protein HslJ
MDGFWQSRGGRLLAAGVVIGLAAVILAVLIPDRETTDLGGTSWTLVAYGPAGAPMPAQAPASITFEANGRFSGFDGCNGFSGNYSAAAGRLSFVNDEVAFTTQDCDPATPAGAQDAFFRQYLRSGIPYSQLDRELVLRLADGQVAGFAPAP